MNKVLCLENVVVDCRSWNRTYTAPQPLMYNSAMVWRAYSILYTKR
jgi:hypothetical protein